MRTEIEIEQSQTLSNLGHCFTMRGHHAIEREDKKVNFDKAIKAFTDSIAIKRPGDEREGQTYSRRGQLRLEQSIWPLAEQDFNKAIGIFECASNIFELGLAYFRRARVLANKPAPNHDGAIADLRRAEKLFEELRDLKNQFCILMELAKIENARGNSGVDYATKAFEVAEKGNLEEEQMVAARFLENPKA
jgi:tetratricopeptide (TPR) repeat protein